MFREFAPRSVGDRGRTMRGDLIKTSIDTSLVGEPSHGAPLRIVMILASGFVAELSQPLAAGSAIAANLPGLGLVSAQVQWTFGDRSGFKFAAPLTLDQLKRLA